MRVHMARYMYVHYCYQILSEICTSDSTDPLEMMKNGNPDTAKLFLCKFTHTTEYIVTGSFTAILL